MHISTVPSSTTRSRRSTSAASTLCTSSSSSASSSLRVTRRRVSGSPSPPATSRRNIRRATCCSPSPSDRKRPRRGGRSLLERLQCARRRPASASGLSAHATDRAEPSRATAAPCFSGNFVDQGVDEGRLDLEARALRRSLVSRAEARSRSSARAERDSVRRDPRARCTAPAGREVGTQANHDDHAPVGIPCRLDERIDEASSLRFAPIR